LLVFALSDIKVLFCPFSGLIRDLPQLSALRSEWVHRKTVN